MPRTLGFALSLTFLSLIGTNAFADSFEEELAILEERLRLASGMAVADLGAGKGAYAVALAERVGPEGRVFATELDDERLETLREKKQEADLTQLEIVPGAFDGTALAPSSVDGALLRDVYHHVTAPEPFVRSIYETLRPGARIVVVDFPPTFWLALWTPEGIPESRGGHGIEASLLISEFEAAGFRRVEVIDPWPSSNFVTKTYAVVFERP